MGKSFYESDMYDRYHIENRDGTLVAVFNIRADQQIEDDNERVYTKEELEHRIEEFKGIDVHADVSVRALADIKAIERKANPVARPA